jgi:hypothetical protein
MCTSTALAAPHASSSTVGRHGRKPRAGSRRTASQPPLGPGSRAGMDPSGLPSPGDAGEDSVGDTISALRSEVTRLFDTVPADPSHSFWPNRRSRPAARRREMVSAEEEVELKQTGRRLCEQTRTANAPSRVSTTLSLHELTEHGEVGVTSGFLGSQVRHQSAGAGDAPHRRSRV